MSLSRLYTYTPTTCLSFVADDVDQIITAVNVLQTSQDADHTGVAGGQTFTGGNASGDPVTLQSSSHATKGPIILSGSLVQLLPSSGTTFDVGFSTAGTNSHAIRLMATNTLAVSPDGAAIQLYSNSASSGRVFIDTGANASAAIIFRSAIAAGTITERMRVSATGMVGINQGSPATRLHITATDGTGAITLDKETTTPAAPASSAEIRLYHKGNLVVFQYNDAGTTRYN